MTSKKFLMGYLLCAGCAVVALLPRASAQSAKALPPGAASCAFDALTNDPDPAGLNVRQSPDANAPILGRLPPVESTESAIGTVLPEFHVIGIQNGWFLIEGAHYDPGYSLPKNLPKLYAGRGWVSGNLISTGLRTLTLKSAPDSKAPDVVALSGTNDEGGAFGPDSIKVQKILNCSGAWFEVGVARHVSGITLAPKLSSDGPKDVIRGWTDEFCTQQLTTCS
jgi:hypothetical protein